MLAMSAPHHRALLKEEEMVPINHWEVRYLDDEQGWVRSHRYSNAHEPTDPPPPPAYNTPSPGNAAAFEAAVGLHANDWFNLDGPNAINFADPLDQNFEINLDDPGSILFPDHLNQHLDPMVVPGTHDGNSA